MVTNVLYLGYNFIYTNLMGRVVFSVVYARRSLSLSQTSTLYAGVSIEGLWQPWSVSYTHVSFDQRMLLLLALRPPIVESYLFA